MGSRFFGGLTAADGATLTNAVIGFLAVILAPVDHELAARLILIAAVADGVDGILARRFGGSEVGPYLDSLADVSSFTLAPAALVYVYVQGLTIPWLPPWLVAIVTIGVPAMFVALGVLRLGVYSTYDTTESETVGAPTTLAATLLATALLTVHATPEIVLGGTFVVAVCMVAPIGYPDLLARDALIMGGIHVLAVLFPHFYGRVFPYALLTLALLYLTLAPWLYWGESERRLRRPAPTKGKQS